jgi:cytochrome c peroxidase
MKARALLMITVSLGVGLVAAATQSGCGGSAKAEPQGQPVTVGERPAIERHLDQADLVSGKVSFDEMFNVGEQLFVAKFNKLDGQGRPGATGNGVPSKREIGSAPDFLRTSSPESNSCAGCHNDPRPGGAGDFVANVFVLAQVKDPVTFDCREADERNTLGMMGSGAIELLTREMSRDLQAIRTAAIEKAQTDGSPVTVPLDTKGVNFGSLTANPDGSVDTSQVSGVDTDLIIKPFSQKGVVRSLREFTVNAMNHHHGMEAVERFGVGQKDNQSNPIATNDFDGDGVPDELTIGDITAVTIFQAFLNIPGQMMPGEPERAQAALQGEQLFNQIGCDSCHVPALVLNDTKFCEPYDQNPPGTLSDQAQKVCFDLTNHGPGPRLVHQADGKSALIRAFTDLKRHTICDAQDPFYCNETLVQNGVPTGQFLTRKLWDVGNTAPYGHRGDLTTITEAIVAHGAEGRASRDAFNGLPQNEQAAIVEFLKTLQVLPEGSAAPVLDTLGRQVDKQALALRLGVTPGS